jgi:hypothetical protein
MRLTWVVALLWAFTAHAEAPAPFPLPSPDGKPLAATAGQHTFRVPFRFARVEQFYKERFGRETKVTLAPSVVEGRHVLTLKSSRGADTWARAVIKEGEVDTTVEVTPVLRAGEERVEGNGRPLVELVLTRSKDFDAMVNSIDHTSDAKR